MKAVATTHVGIERIQEMAESHVCAGVGKRARAVQVEAHINGDMEPESRNTSYNNGGSNGNAFRRTSEWHMTARNDQSGQVLRSIPAGSSRFPAGDSIRGAKPPNGLTFNEMRIARMDTFSARESGPIKLDLAVSVSQGSRGVRASGSLPRVNPTGVAGLSTIGGGELLTASRIESRSGGSEEKSITSEMERMTAPDFACVFPTIATFGARAHIKPPFGEGPRNAWTLELAQKAGVLLGGPIERCEQRRSGLRNQRRRGPLAQPVSLNDWPRTAETASQHPLLLRDIREWWEKVTKYGKAYANSDDEPRFWRNPTTCHLDQFLARICERPVRWCPSAGDLVALKKSGRPVLSQRAPGVEAAIRDARLWSPDGRCEKDSKAAQRLRAEPDIPGNSSPLRVSEEDLRRRVARGRAVPRPAGLRQRLERDGIRGSSGQVETGFRPRSTPLLPREVPCGGLQFCSVCRVRSFPARLETR